MISTNTPLGARLILAAREKANAVAPVL